jgi:hypothetical protein
MGERDCPTNPAAEDLKQETFLTSPLSGTPKNPARASRDSRNSRIKYFQSAPKD